MATRGPATHATRVRCSAMTAARHGNSAGLDRLVHASRRYDAVTTKDPVSITACVPAPFLAVHWFSRRHGHAENQVTITRSPCANCTNCALQLVQLTSSKPSALLYVSERNFGPTPGHRMYARSEVRDSACTRVFMWLLEAGEWPPSHLSVEPDLVAGGWRLHLARVPSSPPATHWL